MSMFLATLTLTATAQEILKVGQKFLNIVLLYLYLFLLLPGQESFPRMDRPIEKGHLHLFLEEVAMCAGHKVSMVVDVYFTACW